MTDTDARIEQFRKMANDDPNNEIGHFSLGRVLLEAGQDAEAAKAFQRCLALNPKIGKAYQLLAKAQLNTGHRDLAIQSLQQGVRIAHERGELMPRNEMIESLKELGAEVPAVTAAQPDVKVGEGQIQCKRCGRVMPKMADPPFRSALGKRIQDSTCSECWREWIGMGTKVINELRLPLNDPQAQKLYDQHMLEFLNLSA
jgi:Fe-S cluster biosynthesis and repair protein YggX/predicted TPR repeat methyltransferase